MSKAYQPNEIFTNVALMKKILTSHGRVSNTVDPYVSHRYIVRPICLP